MPSRVIRTQALRTQALRTQGLKMLARCTLAAGALALAGCGLEVKQDYLNAPSNRGDPHYYDSDTDKPTSIFGGEGGFDLLSLGDPPKQGAAGGGTGLGVNGFLWRATLDTIAFMPLTSADPFGGVIITDWYTPPEAPAERFKMNVYIMGRELRADGVRVAVFRQRAGGNGTWIDAALKAETATSLENQILTRARQLRLASARQR